jgi:hypothetical protein
LSDNIVPVVAISSVVGGFVIMVGMIINAIVKVKIAKYNSLQTHQRPDASPGKDIWPPPPKSPAA